MQDHIKARIAELRADIAACGPTERAELRAELDRLIEMLERQAAEQREEEAAEEMFDNLPV
ncbi:hypothetical protein [Aestuariicoccus sp. MJ-SS9]|uniref:hypothetical protein n=1 Tax=Aestuariicoccus sp. MJ-SS9 TaxID=3079855 RepID=UPI00290E96DC|nr:hypothetical protein [Aestuariicoccus sp. MJ-SS9]MDU8913724.1 hypothetical protein [Aestuariicoccus sp. MJ-SS9]